MNFERENPKRIISTRGELGPLQMVLEPDIRPYASEEAVSRRDRHKAMCSKDTGLKGGGFGGGSTSIGGRKDCQRRC